MYGRAAGPLLLFSDEREVASALLFGGSGGQRATVQLINAGPFPNNRATLAPVNGSFV